MRIIPLKEIPALEAEETITAIRGRVTELYPPKTGENDNGKWSFQNIKLKDETGEIQVKLKDRPALPQSLKGKTIFIYSAKGDKGLSGLKAKDDTYRDKTSRIVWVTPSATIEESDGAPQNGNGNGHANGHDAPPAHQPPPPQAPPAAPVQTAQPPAASATGRPVSPRAGVQSPAPAENHGAVGNVKREINKMANLYVYCLEAASYVEKTWNATHPVQMTDQQFQACASSLFIQASKDGLYNLLQHGMA